MVWGFESPLGHHLNSWMKSGSAVKRLVHAVGFLCALAGGTALVMMSLRSVEPLAGPAGTLKIQVDEFLVLGVLLCLQAALSLHLYFRESALVRTQGRRAIRRHQPEESCGGRRAVPGNEAPRRLFRRERAVKGGCEAPRPYTRCAGGRERPCSTPDPQPMFEPSAGA